MLCAITHPANSPAPTPACTHGALRALFRFPLVPAFADRCRHVEARIEGRAPHSLAFALWRHLAHLPGNKDMNDLASDRFASPAVPVARAAAAACRRAEGHCGGGR